MENKLEYQTSLFSNRLKKRYKELRKWARKNRVTCYRLYDKDIPEIPVSLDLYEFLPDEITTTVECALFMNRQNTLLSQNVPGTEAEIKNRTFAVLYLYERPYEKDQAEETQWLNSMANTAAEILGINISHIVQKQRKMQKGLNQYEKNDSINAITGLIQEQGQLFKINLSTYLDTGLFMDHRPLRSIIRDSAGNKNVLNLFCYTGSFSVYAAQGNARFINSVDLSNTYLAWAKENLKQNGFKDENKFKFTKADVMEFLKENISAKTDIQKYDIIVLDPPTFSNSKSTQNVLDINKQWPELVNNCLKLLSPEGILYFSTNSTRLRFDEALINMTAASDSPVHIEDITEKSIPEDFKGTKCHKCWKIYLE